MLHLRLVVPPDRFQAVVARPEDAGVTNIMTRRLAMTRPPGHIAQADVVRGAGQPRRPRLPRLPRQVVDGRRHIVQEVPR